MIIKDLLRMLEAKNHQLDEGFSDYSVMGSDEASNALHEMAAVMAKSLKKELKNKSSEYNTPGPVNVAMIINEYLQKFKGIDEIASVAKDTAKALEEEIKKPSIKHPDKLKAILKKLKTF